MQHIARCSCGGLSVRATGQALKVSACHCKSCQRRTGSAFGVAVFYNRHDVTAEGASHTFLRTGDSGKALTFHFCPSCGSTVYWYPDFRPGLVAIAFGCFDEAGSLALDQSVYDENAHSWVHLATAKTAS